MRELHIDIKNKIATYSTRGGAIVCGNNDYKIRFTFDSEWDEYEYKTVRFIWNGKYIDVVILEDTVSVPMLSQTTELKVGVYAGEKLYTTTPANIPCLLSVLCESDRAKEADYYEVNGTLEYRLPVIRPEDDTKLLQAVDGVYELREIPDLTMNSEVVNEVLGRKVKPVEAIALQNQADIKALQAELKDLDDLPTLILGETPDDTTLDEMGKLLNTDAQTIVGAINELNDREIKGAYYNPEDEKWYKRMFIQLGEKIFEGEINIASLNYRPKYSLFDLSLVDIEVEDNQGLITIGVNTIKELWELLPDETQTKITAWYNDKAKPWLDEKGAEIETWYNNTAKPWIDEVAPEVEGWYNDTAKPWLENAGADIQEWLGDSTIAEKVGDTVDVAKETLNNTITETKAQLETTITETEKTLNDNLDTAKTELQTGIDKAQGWIDEKGEIIRKWFAGELDEAEEFFATANEKIQEFGKETAEGLSNLKSKVDGEISEGVTKAKEWVNGVGADINEWLDNGEENASKFADKIKESGEEAVAETKAGLAEVRAFLENLGGDLSEWGEDVLAKFQSLFIAKSETETGTIGGEIRQFLLYTLFSDLGTDAQTIVGAINELDNCILGIEMGENPVGVAHTALKADELTEASNLKTTAKTTIGAINEINVLATSSNDNWQLLEDGYLKAHHSVISDALVGESSLETEAKTTIAAINEINAKIGTGGSSLPSCSTSNNGQFLMVVDGVPTWTTVPNAEGSEF